MFVYFDLKEEVYNKIQEESAYCDDLFGINDLKDISVKNSRITMNNNTCR
jgi:hypothetical protein